MGCINVPFVHAGASGVPVGEGECSRPFPHRDSDEAQNVVASPERIRAWLTMAKPGDEFVYASRCWLPAGAPGAETARVLQAQGLVYLFQRPVSGRLVRNYVMQRSSQPLASPDTRPPASAPREEREEVEIAARRVLPILERAAQFGRPCPTNMQIALRADVEREIVPHAIERLRTGGLIAVRAVPAPTLRVVTIADTGASTGMLNGNRG